MTGEIEKLFERQVQAWPQLAKGVAGLARARTRTLRMDWFDIFLRHIPHRAASTTAPVDQESISNRPCFLCAPNLPPEEESLQFGEDFAIYCNPFPIVIRHLTIAHRRHGSQRIAGQFGRMLDLAAALPGYFVIYNGPECGASAPDHMHFQAGARDLFPIETDTAGVSSLSASIYARQVIVFRGSDRVALVDRMDRAIYLLGEVTGKRPEPMVNIAVFRERGQWVTYLFPRGKHRPEVFYTGELTVSPASIDLCGIFVVAVAGDFEKITGGALTAVLQEVSLPESEFRHVVDRLERGH